MKSVNSTKFHNRIIALFTAVMLLCSGVFYACAFDADTMKDKGEVSKGFSIINGYSKLSAQQRLNDYFSAVVYSGLDLNNPYFIMLAGIFYFTNGVDIDRVMTDHAYALEKAEKLDGFIKSMSISNERAEELKEKLKSKGIKINSSLDSLGIIFISADEKQAEELYSDSSVDFVLAGGKVPSSMKDLNMDGKSDRNDAVYIQKHLAKMLKYEDSDIEEYIKYACDINGDKELNIDDVSSLLKS